MLEKGYRHARVQDIANRAGLTTGAIYASFGGKAELLVEAIRRQGPVVEAERVAAGLAATSASEAVAGALAAPSHPYERLLLESWSAALHDERVRDGVLAERERLRERLTLAFGPTAVEAKLDRSWVTILEALLTGAQVLRALDVDRPTVEELAPVVQRITGSLLAAGSAAQDDVDLDR
jgi:AcrR family transcriptional regulator